MYYITSYVFSRLKSYRATIPIWNDHTRNLSLIPMPVACRGLAESTWEKLKETLSWLVNHTPPPFKLGVNSRPYQGKQMDFRERTRLFLGGSLGVGWLAIMVMVLFVYAAAVIFKFLLSSELEFLEHVNVCNMTHCLDPD